MQGHTERHPTLLIGAHIHLHDCYAPDAFLEHAHRNFERAGQQRGWEPALGVLILTESAGADRFGRLASMAVGAMASRALPPGPWSIEESPADLMGSALGWGPERREAEVDATDVALRDAVAVPSSRKESP